MSPKTPADLPPAFPIIDYILAAQSATIVTDSVPQLRPFLIVRAGLKLMGQAAPPFVLQFQSPAMLDRFIEDCLVARQACWPTVPYDLGLRMHWAAGRGGMPAKFDHLVEEAVKKAMAESMAAVLKLIDTYLGYIEHNRATNQPFTAEEAEQGIRMMREQWADGLASLREEIEAFAAPSAPESHQDFTPDE